eukprot:GHVN01091278.1.p1 GENE.GHVN01091278.1~~GHVN01091278.1.p1  ORF type:complete len:478 (-),score=98.43 GHVN01091278.1:24-1457(-)
MTTCATSPRLLAHPPCPKVLSSPHAFQCSPAHTFQCSPLSDSSHLSSSRVTDTVPDLVSAGDVLRHFTNLIPERPDPAIDCYALYSSLYGGIIIDQQVMMFPTEHNIFRRAVSVYDSCSVVNGNLYRGDSHIDRFFRAMSLSSMSPAFERDTLRELIVSTVASSHQKNATVLFWISGPSNSLQLNLLPKQASQSSNLNPRQPTHLTHLTAPSHHAAPPLQQNKILNPPFSSMTPPSVSHHDQVTDTQAPPQDSLWVLVFNSGDPPTDKWCGMAEVTVSESSIPVGLRPTSCVSGKSTPFHVKMILKKQAAKRGGRYGVWINTKGCVAECSMGVVMVVDESGRKIGIARQEHTANGIVMRRVQSLIKHWMDADGAYKPNRPQGLENQFLAGSLLSCEVREIKKSELFQASEVILLTNDITVVSVAQLDGQKIGDGRAGPLFRRIATALEREGRDGLRHSHRIPYEDYPSTKPFFNSGH